MSIECLLCSQYGAPTHPGEGRVDSRNVQIGFQDFSDEFNLYFLDVKIHEDA